MTLREQVDKLEALYSRWHDEPIRYHGRYQELAKAVVNAWPALRDAALRLSEIETATKADADDLAKMRDGTKMTRAGLVETIVYQQQELATAARSLEEAEAQRNNLLARIFRDGGQTQAAYINAQAACHAAEGVVAGCIQRAEEAERELTELRNQNAAIAGHLQTERAIALKAERERDEARAGLKLAVELRDQALAIAADNKRLAESLLRSLAGWDGTERRASMRDMARLAVAAQKAHKEEPIMQWAERMGKALAEPDGTDGTMAHPSPAPIRARTETEALSFDPLSLAAMLRDNGKKRDARNEIHYDHIAASAIEELAAKLSAVPRAAPEETFYGVRSKSGYWVGIWSERTIAELVRSKGNDDERIVELVAAAPKETKE